MTYLFKILRKEYSKPVNLNSLKIHLNIFSVIIKVSALNKVHLIMKPEMIYCYEFFPSNLR